MSREVQGQSHRVLVYLLPAVCGALLINITKFFEVTNVNVCKDFTGCDCGHVIRWVKYSGLHNCHPSEFLQCESLVATLIPRLYTQYNFFNFLMLSIEEAVENDFWLKNI